MLLQNPNFGFGGYNFPTHPGIDNFPIDRADLLKGFQGYNVDVCPVQWTFPIPPPSPWPTEPFFSSRLNRVLPLQGGGFRLVSGMFALRPEWGPLMGQPAEMALNTTAGGDSKQMKENLLIEVGKHLQNENLLPGYLWIGNQIFEVRAGPASPNCTGGFGGPGFLPRFIKIGHSWFRRVRIGHF